MKHFMLKFNHGVEVGAELAYRGHYRRTADLHISRIADDEECHQEALRLQLEHRGEMPSPVFDWIFLMVGFAVAKFCQVCPLWSLNLVARTMEVFAVFSYERLAKLYPEDSAYYLSMAETEREHAAYFKNGARHEIPQDLR